MNSLEQLFAFGYASDTFDIMGVKFTLTVLDAKRLTDALNSSNGDNPSAQLLDYKQHVLARAITAINGQSQFKNQQEPTAEEINNLLNNVINKFHYSIVNALFDNYEKLDISINNSVEDDVKKSQSSRGA